MSDGLVVVLNVSLHPSEARVIERVCAAYDAALAEGRSGDAVGSGAATATHRLYLRSAVGLPPYGSVPLHPVLHQLLTPVTFAYEGPQLAEKLREAVVAEVWGCGGVRVWGVDMSTAVQEVWGRMYGTVAISNVHT